MKPKKKIVPYKFVVSIRRWECPRNANKIHSQHSNHRRWKGSNHIWILASISLHRQQSKVSGDASLHCWMCHCWRIEAIWTFSSDCPFSMWPKWISKWSRRSFSPIWVTTKPMSHSVYRSRPSQTFHHVLLYHRFVIAFQSRNAPYSSFPFCLSASPDQVSIFGAMFERKGTAVSHELFCVILVAVMAEQTEFNMVLTWLFICGFFRGLH